MAKIEDEIFNGKTSNVFWELATFMEYITSTLLSCRNPATSHRQQTSQMA